MPSRVSWSYITVLADDIATAECILFEKAEPTAAARHLACEKSTVLVFVYG